MGKWEPKTHLRDERTFARSGVSYPMCHTESSNRKKSWSDLPMTSEYAEVTCKQCLKMKLTWK